MKRPQRKPGTWLTAEQIERLRAMRAKGMKLRVIADRFNISISAASRIASYDRRAA